MDKITALAEVQKMIPRRREDAHKGDFGRVVLFAGSQRFTGAAYFCAQAAVRTGSGLVTLVTPQEVVPILSCKLNEAMVLPQNSSILPELLERADVIALGCGMGNDETTYRIVDRVLKIKKEVPIVLDADAINVLRGEAERLRGRKNILITPHEMEFARLTQTDLQNIKSFREHTAIRFAQEYQTNLLLKGKNSIIANSEDYRINPTGSSKMASGGMGDALTGIIASLAGQGLEIYKAGYVGAYIHGYAADQIGKDRYCVTATDVIEFLPYAIYQIQANEGTR